MRDRTDIFPTARTAVCGTYGARKDVVIGGVTGTLEDGGSFKAVIERTAVSPTLPGDLTTKMCIRDRMEMDVPAKAIGMS